MKLVTFKSGGRPRLGAVKDGAVIDMALAAQDNNATLPDDIMVLLHLGDGGLEACREVMEDADPSAPYAQPLEAAELLAPVPKPTSVRDGYAFRQHVKTARANRGAEMIPEFDEFPVFYFTNHHAIFGPGPVKVMPRHLDRLDFELECAIVIGKAGSNIPAARADEHIAGYMVMNDLSARALQMQEMKLSLGPAKGKDFATTLGPWLVTKDELESKRIGSADGDRYDLKMTATVNDVQTSEDSLKNMTWTFAQIIERASYGVQLQPGDVIGSGTCGTGCFLELNGSGITDNQWLQTGDTIELTIEGLGSLSNTIVVWYEQEQ